MCIQNRLWQEKHLLPTYPCKKHFEHWWLGAFWTTELRSIPAAAPGAGYMQASPCPVILGSPSGLIPRDGTEPRLVRGLPPALHWVCPAQGGPHCPVPSGVGWSPAELDLVCCVFVLGFLTATWWLLLREECLSFRVPCPSR